MKHRKGYLAIAILTLVSTLAHGVDADEPQPTTAPAAPPVVVVQSDGSLLLPAGGARIHGYRLRLETKPAPTLVHWVDVTEMIEWPHAVDKKGTYQAEITYSCPEHAGGEFILSAGANKITANAQHTADWQTFITVKIGKLKVLNDHTTILLRGKDFIQKALIDVRSVKLTPVEDAKE